MRNKLILLIIAVVFLVGCSDDTTTIPGEITNVVAVTGWEPVAQGGPTEKTVGQAGDSSRGGYSNSVFFVGFDDPGQWAEWNMSIPEAGQYQMIIRYSTHEEPVTVRRNFKLRAAGEDITASYVDVTYDLHTGRVGTDGDRWMFYMSEPLELKAGEHSLRMEYIFDEAQEDDRQFSNLLMIGFVAIEPADGKVTQGEYIEALDNYLGL